MIRSRQTALVALIALVFAGSARAESLYTTASNGIALGVINSSTGAGAVIGSFGYSNVYGLAFSPGGTLYTEAGGFLGTVNVDKGAVSRIGTSNGPGVGGSAVLSQWNALCR